MKFKFKMQGYQTDAVENTTKIFVGQPNRDPSKYRRDLGKRGSGVIRFEGDDDGYRNADVELSSKQLLENLHLVQTLAGVPLSKSLSKIDGFGAVNLDVEMEIGTARPMSISRRCLNSTNSTVGLSSLSLCRASLSARA